MRHGEIFLNDLGLSLGPNLVSTNDRPSIFSVIFKAFFQAGARKKKCVAFFMNLLEVLHGMSVEFFAQTIEDLTCLHQAESSEKMDPTLKPSYLKETAILLILHTKSPNLHVVLERETLKICTCILQTQPED